MYREETIFQGETNDFVSYVQILYRDSETPAALIYLLSEA